jgi:glycosyltransferase involved in cell wall biosynthesis
MKLTFVLPRYGPAVIGGAETAARLLAEHLAARGGWDVEVLTSCADDFVTWADVEPAGREEFNGVSVVRFASRSGRDPSFHPFSASLLVAPEQATLAEAEHWVDLQGPVLPELVDAAAASDADALVFYPYLYYPTVRVIDRVKQPTILHPAAHDEPALRLPVFRSVFAAADGLVFQTEAERELVQGLFPVASHRQLLLGLGVDDPDVRRPPASPPSARPNAPYLLCLGRVEPKKGTSLLASLFARYKECRGGALRLVLAGPIVDAPDEHPDVDLIGTVSDDEKWALLEGAVALVAPSPWEAFSLVVAEAWSARTPVMVNDQCAATVEHCHRSGGGVTFGGYREFEVGVDVLSNDPQARRSLGDRGRGYVDRRFRWPHVVDRYVAFVEAVVSAAG